MKKWLKRIGLGVLGLLVVAVGALAVVFYALHPRSRAAPDLKAPSTPEAIARGSYLANHVTFCVACHSPVDESQPGSPLVAGKLLAGRQWGEGVPGRVVAHNLTPDRETGVGAWTDGELVRAIREGVDRDGKALFPMMPYPRFKQLTDEDTLAIVAYLRSVPAIKLELPATSIDFPVSMFIRLAPQPLAESPPKWPTDPVARGKILLEVMSCIDCHTPMTKGQPIESLRFAGGLEFKESFGTVHASNITPDQATGIGAYSDDDLMRVFREGKGKDGRALWVMPWTATQETDEADLRAVIAALRALPPVAHVVPPPELKR